VVSGRSLGFALLSNTRVIAFFDLMLAVVTGPATGNENPAQGMGFGRRLSGVPKSLGGTLGLGV